MNIGQLPVLIEAITYLVVLVYWIGVTIVVITDEREPTVSLAWLLVLLAFPVIGLIFYWLFGRNWKKNISRSNWAVKVKQQAEPTIRRIHETYAATTDEAHAWAKERDYDALVNCIISADDAYPLPAYGVTIFPSGAEKFAKLKEDLAKATDTINIQYFIWERDELTHDLTEILVERLKAGVEVRMLNDWLGNIKYKKDEMKRLREAGAKVLFDMTDLRRMNYRNHRKIVVIDGWIGYTGGMNVGQEYIDGKPHYSSWRDTHTRFTGPAVADLQKLFAIRWSDRGKENLFNDRFFPLEYKTEGRRTIAQTVSQGVETWWDPGRRAHDVAISHCHERVWIQSPYFVPTPDIYQTMINMALAGKDVRLMMTGVPDSVIAWRAAESYFGMLLQAGGKIYRYEAGFFHAKTIVVDGQMTAIGTMNLDTRSLALHKELMVWHYDQELAAQQEGFFLEDMKNCAEITLETVASWSGAHRLRNSASRLASNIM